MNLARLLAHGQGVAKDLPRAAQLFTKSAEQGNAAAHCYLAMYANGYGRTRDFKEAARWYSEALVHRVPQAGANDYLYCIQGEIVPCPTAVGNWYRAKAELRKTEATSIVAFAKSDGVLRYQAAIDRFLAILSWLYGHHPEAFEEFRFYRPGERILFARTPTLIQETFGCKVPPKQIPHAPYWVQPALTNECKKRILEDILKMLKYSVGEINQVLDVFAWQPKSDFE